LTPTDSRTVANKGGVCPGGFGGTPPEAIADIETEFNRGLEFYALVNLKPQ